MELISKKELKEILIKGWMTHDAMWVLHCLRKTGIGILRPNEVQGGKMIKKGCKKNE